MAKAQKIEINHRPQVYKKEVNESVMKEKEMKVQGFIARMRNKSEKNQKNTEIWRNL